ncbi:MAG: 4-(cytidine 5'-diphospho)-2-C-methyl-D-erythritol kinase [Bacteroidales bacterium]
MTLFPNAKINIGLRIVSRRDDGFHNIETIFYPVMVRDILEFVGDDSGNDSDSLTSTGLVTGCAMKDNLVIRALNLLRLKYNIPALHIHLHKAIPAGSGLGGGSSDAAFMLRYLNRFYRLGLCNNDLKKLALELGSDCPFFIENRPMYATGRGEELTPVKPVPGKHFIMIVNPGIEVNTGDAYRLTTPRTPSSDLRKLYNLPVNEWKGKIVNDFEEVVFKLHPEIGEIRENLYGMGAIYASMSGSGSSVFGLFDSAPKGYHFDGNYFTWSGMI